MLWVNHLLVASRQDHRTMSDWNSRYHIFKQQAYKYAYQINLNDFEHASYCSLHKKYFYGESPKTGCSTVKKVLIQAELGKRINFAELEYIHYREFNPFLKISQVGDLDEFFQRSDIFKFCFVRNPYTRLLSCYLDKIKKDRYQNQQIKIQMGLRPDAEETVTFPQFVASVMQQSPMHMDPHWRIQYFQTFQKKIDYDFIGRFENFVVDFLFVLQQLDIDPEKYYDAERSHATNAEKNLAQYYTDEIAEQVYHKYQLDFKHFGYEKELPNS